MNFFKNSWVKPIIRSILGAFLISLFWFDLSRSYNEERPRIFFFLNEEQGEAIPDADNTDKNIVAAKPKLYRDGTFSASSSTPWGPLAISITVKDGVWTDLKYLALSKSPPTRYAAKTLVDQALAAQKAEIDGVSGATYTSRAFRDDLSKIVAQSKL